MTDITSARRWSNRPTALRLAAQALTIVLVKLSTFLSCVFQQRGRYGVTVSVSCAVWVRPVETAVAVMGMV